MCEFSNKKDGVIGTCIYLVVEACAIILPPMGFFGSAENMAAAPST